MDIGLYIHIPFCLSKCYYCDFTSYVSTREKQEEYVEALVNEIKAYKKSSKQELTIKTIFIGGGTPSVLPPVLLEKIMSALNKSFNIGQDLEYTMEANPGSLSRKQLTVMKRYGVNRISMGAQAYQDHLLKKIGRSHTWQDLENTYFLSKELGFNNINLDLMFGLPGQTLANWKETLRQAVKLGPDHISTYGLIVEANTPFGHMYQKGELDLLDDELERQMYYRAKEYLQENGYKQYEISNFAKQGKPSRHNIDCWQMHPYIGIGLGAHSYFQNTRYHNTDQMQAYIKNSNQLNLIQQGKETIEVKAQMEEYIFLGLRLTRGLNLYDFNKKFNQSIKEIYGDQIRQNKKDGLLKEENGQIFLTSFGQDVSNRVLSSFIL